MKEIKFRHLNELVDIFKSIFKMQDVTLSRVENTKVAAKSLRDIVNLVGLIHLITLLYLFIFKKNQIVLVACELVACIYAWVCGLTETGNVLTGSRFLTREDDYRCYSTCINSVSMLFYMFSFNLYVENGGDILTGLYLYLFTQVLTFVISYMVQMNNRKKRLCVLNKVLQLISIITIIVLPIVFTSTNNLVVTLVFIATILVCSLFGYINGIFKYESYCVKKLLKENKKKNNK